MASYAKIADKLSKKLGEYEGILEGKAGSSTEPTDVKTAKLKIPQIQKALSDLEESQKIEVKIKELIDQGVPKEEATQAVMQQVQQEQMQMQQQQQQQMQMQQQQEQQQQQPQQQQQMPQQMQQPQQQMPMDPGMSPYKSGGALPTYQANNAFVGMGGGPVSLPSGQTGNMDASGNFASGGGGGGGANIGGIANAATWGLGTLGTVLSASQMVNSNNTQKNALENASQAQPLTDSWGQSLPTYQVSPDPIEGQKRTEHYYKYPYSKGEVSESNIAETDVINAAEPYLQKLPKGKARKFRNAIDKVSNLNKDVTTDPVFTKTLNKLKSDPTKYMDQLVKATPEEGLNWDNFLSTRSDMKSLREDLGLTQKEVKHILKQGGMGIVNRNLISAVLKGGGYIPEPLPSYQAKDSKIPWGQMANIGLGAAATAPIWRNIQMSQEPIDYYKAFENPYRGAMEQGLEDMGRLTGEAEEAMRNRAYNPRAELVAANRRKDAAMQNTRDASGGSARFALQNRARAQQAADTDQILTKAQNINSQSEAQKAQGLAGLAGAYGNMGRMQYGLGQDLGAERWKEFDYAQRAEAARRGFGTQATMDTSEWAQTQQEMLGQRTMDKLSVSQMSYLLDNFEWKDGKWVSKTSKK